MERHDKRCSCRSAHSLVAESAGNPIHHQLGVAVADGKWRARSSIRNFNSALFATITTDASWRPVNRLHDSFTALAALCRFSISS